MLISKLNAWFGLLFPAVLNCYYKIKMQASARDALASLAYTLLLETPVSTQRIAKNAKKLGLKDNLPRIPVYISIFTE